MGLSGAAVAQDRETQLGEAARLNQTVLDLIEADRYADAMPLAQRALAIRERLLGPEHSDVAMSLNNLALVYRGQGDYGRAADLFLRGLRIGEKVLGPQNLDLAIMLGNLARVYVAQNDLASAEPLYVRCLAIRENAKPTQTTAVADILDDLGWLYYKKGDYARAEPLYLRALSIRQRVLPEAHPDIAESLNDLALLYQDFGAQYERAEPLLKRALAIREASGPEHPSVAEALNNLAELYREEGEYVRAEPLYRRALSIREKMLPDGQLGVADVLNNLALLYKENGEYSRAEPLYLRALAIQEEVPPADSPDVALSLLNLAGLYAAVGDYDKSVVFLRRGLEIRERNLLLVLSTGSEDQKQLYLNTLSGDTSSSVSLHIHLTPKSAEAAQLAVTTILRRKGRSLDAMTDQIADLRRSSSPQDQALLDRLVTMRSQLATLRLSAAGNLPLDVRRERINSTEAEIDHLEGEIGRRSAGFRARTQPVTLEGVLQALPSDAALVEFFKFHPYHPRATNRVEKFGKPRYVAYVVRRNDGMPQFVDLGSSEDIDANVEILRAALKDPKRTDVQNIARAVDERVMGPVRRLLGETRRVFLSPDGALNFVPFAALVDENGKYLVENYSLTYLTSGRDLLRLQIPTKSRSEPLVLADPLFDMAAARSRPAHRLVNQRSLHGNANRRSLDFSLQTYRPLPGTAEEAAALGNLLPDARLLTQGAATETALKQVRSPRLLHIATHGFFLPSAPQVSPADHPPLRGTLDMIDGSALPARWENPLLRSGLILAGVRQGLSGASDDGVLTALEMAGLDLWGTKLVVLSACETGLGEVQDEAGVYGLRRALVLAGSETQVISLWKVSDTGTRDLMTAYYSRLQKGEGRGEALRQVQLMMLRRTLNAGVSSGKPGMAEKVATKDYSHPYYWGAFIQSGDWRSMDGK